MAIRGFLFLAAVYGVASTFRQTGDFLHRQGILLEEQPGAIRVILCVVLYGAALHCGHAGLKTEPHEGKALVQIVAAVVLGAFGLHVFRTLF